MQRRRRLVTRRRVVLHYGPRWRAAVQPGLHGAVCEVACWGRGPGPRNVLVRLDDSRMVVVPRGNVRFVRVGDAEDASP